MRLKSVADGQQVNIPAPLVVVKAVWWTRSRRAAGPSRHGPKGDKPAVAEPVAEKSARQGLLAPVPKPTLVGEESILRRSREPPLRNSAKEVRNFGIRTAFCSFLRNCGRPQRRGPGDCLLKTQVCAKAQAHVYRLTRARCHKVKEGGYSASAGKALDQSYGEWRL